MALTYKVDIYTQALRTAFIGGYDAVAEQPAIEECMTLTDSKGRVENYPWMYPPPFLAQWKGYRQYAKLGESNYAVPNITYSAGFEVLLEDFNDDQVGGFKIQAGAMGRAANEYRTIQSLQNLALGQTTPCFDSSNFFATSHTIGTGNNIVTATTAGTDGLTHAMVCLAKTNSVVKPLLWQTREGPTLQTDAGTVESDKARVIKHWATLRGAAAFGFWWDAILVKFTNTPTVAEVQTALGTVNSRFRGFYYPQNLATDPKQYVHGQTRWTDKTLTTICSSGIEHIVRQALTLSFIAQTENYFKGFSDLACSGYLDGIV